MIAIISILASMLLPALSKARASARTITCVNNLRQLFLISQSYAGDNRRYLPAGREVYQGIYNGIQEREGSMRAYIPQAGPQYGAAAGDVCPGVVLCPEGHRFGPAAKLSVYSNAPFSYTYTSWYVRPKVAGGTWDTSSIPPIRMADSKKPSLQMLMADFGWWRGTTLTLSTLKASDLTWRACFGFRHGPDRANILFVDGHVEGQNQLLVGTVAGNPDFWAKP